MPILRQAQQLSEELYVSHLRQQQEYALIQVGHRLVLMR
jgi:hypothetical protein